MKICTAHKYAKMHGGHRQNCRLSIGKLAQKYYLELLEKAKTIKTFKHQESFSLLSKFEPKCEKS